MPVLGAGWETGYVVRRPEPQDAPALYALVSACDTAVLGHPDMTADDVADILADPDLDLARDSWLVHAVPAAAGQEAGPAAPEPADDPERPENSETPEPADDPERPENSEPPRDPAGDCDGGTDPPSDAGTLVGWGYARRQGADGTAEIEVYATDPNATAWLWDAALRRAREHADGLGLPRAIAEIGVYRQDDGKRALAAARGFRAATSFHRLRADHSGPAGDPPPPPGVLIRPAGGVEELMRAAHRVHQDGFAEHFGFVAKDYDRWKADFDSSATHDWAQLLLAQADGVPAGMLLGSDMFVADENCGYVRILAVLPAFRGRGIGRSLLLHAFAADARRGRAGTYLHVDAHNSTPALDLYLSAGMHPVLAIDVWRREV
ncbi:GNAT family N-acetyltransferase [Sphaerisporangium melleum]|uniref:GNAT family N-acetyltransferase n=1 Tax=Sphaerisporangium melleum TaxID=321316 RepID=UPI001E60B1E9|nr:N-acetyltransferase [Sphaerisporangium melleum]